MPLNLILVKYKRTNSVRYFIFPVICSYLYFANRIGTDFNRLNRTRFLETDDRTLTFDYYIVVNFQQPVLYIYNIHSYVRLNPPFYRLTPDQVQGIIPVRLK